MEALGRLVDIGPAFVPVDMSTAANTGKRISLRAGQGLTVVLYKAVGTAAQDPVLTFNQHTASSGGSSAVIAGAVDHFWKKSAATLLGSEAWVLTSFAANSVVTLTGEAVNQGIYVFHVDGARLADTFKYASVDIADVGAAAQLGALLYVVTDLVIARKPSNLRPSLS
jgi:hypothetical protein